VPSESEYVQKISDTFDKLAEIGERLREPHYSRPGSRLAQDDEDWPSLPISQLAWGCFAATFDHLDLVRLTVENERTFVTGTYSVIRGALLGSCQAAWLLFPESAAERRERSRTFANEWYVNRIKWQEGLTPDLPVEAAARSAVQLNRLDADRAALELKRTSKAAFKSTSNIEWVGNALFPDEAPLRPSLMAQWRRLGGDAHALGWTYMTQNTSWEAGRTTADGLTPARVTGSFSDLAEGYLAAWIVSRRAWQRFDELDSAGF
jgi:hypothetical protein